jgi:hypothetical protein
MKYEVIADSSQLKHHLTAQIENSFLGYLHGYMTKVRTINSVPQQPIEATGLIIAKIEIKDGLQSFNYLVHIKTNKDNLTKIEGIIEDTDFFVEGIIDTRFITSVIKVVIKKRE